MATFTWTGAGNTDGTEPTNWQVGGAATAIAPNDPTADAVATINGPDGFEFPIISGDAAITLNSLTVSQTFTGTIGTTATSGTFGYWKIGATSWRIGTPSTDGTTAIGSGRIKIDFGAAAFTGTVLATGSSADVGLEPVRIKGSHAANRLYVLGGRVGVVADKQADKAQIGGAAGGSGAAQRVQDPHATDRLAVGGLGGGR